MLLGEGVLFFCIEVLIMIGGGCYVIDGVWVSGLVFGLMVNGWIVVDGNGIDFDGVLVLSFGVNFVFGGVLIIGDLIVGW